MNDNGTLKIATPVTNIETKQQQPTCKFTITATLRGFPITIEGEGRAGDLKIIVDRLLASGAEPPNATEGKGRQGDGAKASAPTCPAHHTPMKEGRRGFFCPKKVGDGYCKETA